MKVTWKDIGTVPNANEFLDVVLNRTQRKTPTVIRPGFKISRIRAFYMRKVRYTADGFTEKLQEIVDSFPRLDDIHPFHQDLLNTLYDRDHYKIALSQLSMAKHLIDQVSRDYVRLLKFGQSLFQCKQLKRAAMGRMATIVKRLKDPLLYLEQVRQHLGRLPAIDPNTRTLVICGYPNVGKSSFLKSITRADVDVQPYAFTTKSLYVGHFDYKYLRYQAIDTPGILDHPLEEMNTIEMQSITAIAHLRSCILYFMDLSEQCGFSVEAQVNLYHSIKPLFANKTVMVIINKIDAMRPEDLDENRRAMLDTITAEGNVEIMQLSCHLETNLMEVRNAACEKLLAARVEQKLKGTKVNDVLNKIHLAVPMVPRDGVDRSPFIPEAVKSMKKYDPNDPERRKLARDVEAENGGAGVYNINLRDKYMLEKDEWKNDIIPELLDGKNVYDFLDPEIGSKLQALEEEEERLEAEGFYDSEDDDIFETEEDADIRMKAAWIREKKKLIQNENRSRKSLRNRAIIPRSKVRKTLSQMEAHLDSIHVDHTEVTERARGRAAEEKAYEASIDEGGVDTIMREAARSRSRGPAEPTANEIQSSRFDAGLGTKSLRAKADRIEKMHRRERNRLGRAGEADRHVADIMPKHLFAGKRGIGKTSRR